MIIDQFNNWHNDHDHEINVDRWVYRIFSAIFNRDIKLRSLKAKQKTNLNVLPRIF